LGLFLPLSPKQKIKLKKKMENEIIINESFCKTLQTLSHEDVGIIIKGIIENQQNLKEKEIKRMKSRHLFFERLNKLKIK
jgi:hypothetical protein